MYKVTFVQQDGIPQTVKAEEGETVMRAALNGFVRGIVGECGGELSCATCHVFVDPQWMAVVEGAGEDELDMLETTSEEPTSCSRLSCQVKMDSSLDGLVVEIPKTQR